MKVVYLNTNRESITAAKADMPVHRLKTLTETELFDYEMALKGYKKALKKYANRIAEIQKEKPAWLPPFRYGKK